MRRPATATRVPVAPSAALVLALVLRAARAGRVLWLRPAPIRRIDGVPSRRTHRPAFVRNC